MNLNTQQIEAAGFLLTWYRKDLAFFSAFRRFYHQEPRGWVSYCADRPGSFQNFINTYQVTRTLQLGETETLLKICLEWHEAGKWTDVSGLAEEIYKRKIVHGFPLSMASKAMYLMHPEEVLPFDKRAKEALGIKTNRPRYEEYYEKALAFGEKNAPVIDEILSRFSGLLDTLEEGCQDSGISLPKVRRMRLLDKLLWAKK